MKRCLSCEATFRGEGWTCPTCGHRPQTLEGHELFAPALAEGGTGDADYAHDAIVAAEARHFWFDARRRLVVLALRRFCPQARSLLEVGLGTGFVLEGVRAAFPTMATSGTDVLVAALSRAAPRLPGTALFQMDARQIPFRDEFDALLALDVIEHIDDDEAVLREMGSALRPGGALLLTVPQHPWLWSTIDAWSGHRRRYTRRELLARLRDAGLTVCYVTSFTSLLLPLLALGRWRQPSLQELDPLAELRIARSTNALLRSVSGLERALVHVGVRFPVGGSLLAVARRPT